MSLPSLATVPPAHIRLELAPAEWEACLDAWTSLSELYLRSPDESFTSAVKKPGVLDSFLLSLYRELASSSSKDARLSQDNVQSLKKSTFLLVHRISLQPQFPPTLLQWGFFADFAHVYPHSQSLRELLHGMFERHGTGLEASLQKIKGILTKELESAKPEAAEPDLKRITHLLRASTDAGVFFMVGSDFVDALISAYAKAPSPLKPLLTSTLYLGLSALIDSPKSNFSLLSDHLYSLKTQAEAAQKASKTTETILADLVTNTPFLNIMQRQTSSEASRARTTASSLSTFQQPSLRRPRRAPLRKTDKGKARAIQESQASAEMHVHKMSLVSQIQDLFPDLGAGFVMKLLDEYKDNVEEVTAHLLEDSLPAHLQSLDRTEQVPGPVAHQHDNLAPRSTPPPPSPPSSYVPERRNVYDNDEFDRLAVDASRLHFGRKDKGTADSLLSDSSTAPHKAAILSALAAFDSDDDERDDTYDVEDVGGTVDSGLPGAEEADSGNEEVLFKAYLSTPKIFERDALTRRSKEREALRTSTSMTDESIEGWALMLSRDPRRLRRLEARYTAFTGQQREIASSAWRAEDAEDESGERHTSDRMRGGRGGNRGGRGRGGGRGGAPRGGGQPASGNGTGESGPQTQQNRARKEANKSSRANHNRRDQRARKMARGGAPG